MATTEENDVIERPLMIRSSVLEPDGEHTATVLWLHGLGGDASSMLFSASSVLETLGVKGVKFVFPQAPLMEVTGNRCAIMFSWFDCFSFDIETRVEDEKGLFAAVKWINNLIDIEVDEHHIPPHRILIGGLSQGGAVAWLTALTTQRRLGGVFILSSYVPLRNKVSEFVSELASSMPIFWGHGTLDLQVRYKFSVEAARKLATELKIPFLLSGSPLEPEDDARDDKSNIKLRFQAYPGLGHWFSEEELQDLAIWMTAVLS